MTLSRDGWWAVVAALEGDESQRDDAFDALQRWAPRPWLEALDEKEERERAPREAAERRATNDEPRDDRAEQCDNDEAEQ